jgi:hypothetical protein
VTQPDRYRDEVVAEARAFSHSELAHELDEHPWGQGWRHAAQRIEAARRLRMMAELGIGS